MKTELFALELLLSEETKFVAAYFWSGSVSPASAGVRGQSESPIPLLPRLDLAPTPWFVGSQISNRSEAIAKEEVQSLKSYEQYQDQTRLSHRDLRRQYARRGLRTFSIAISQVFNFDN